MYSKSPWRHSSHLFWQLAAAAAAADEYKKKEQYISISLLL